MHPRFWRYIQVRVGMTVILAAVLTLFLGIDLHIWLVPPIVAAFVWLKWRYGEQEDDMDEGRP